MRKRDLIQLIIYTLLLSVFITACTSTNNKDEINHENELHIAAASSLRFAFEEIGMLFEEETNAKIIFQFGSSGNLSQQITNGAPIDLFVAADKKSVEDLIASGDILEETKTIYAIGRIVLAVNKKMNKNVRSLEDLLSADIDCIALANPNHAPYGIAGKEALQSQGLWKSVEDKVIYGESISQTMQFVETGNAPVGILALSIAEVADIEYFLIDEELHSPLEHMLGIVSRTKKQKIARKFVSFLSSSKGEEIMKKYGFDLPK